MKALFSRSFYSQSMHAIKILSTKFHSELHEFDLIMYHTPHLETVTYLRRTQTSWIEALTFCWMSVLVFTSCRFFFCWAYTETLIMSNCKKKAPLELFFCWFMLKLWSRRSPIEAWKKRSKIWYIPGVLMLEQLPPKFKAIFFPFKENQKLFGVNKYHATTWRT